MLSGKLRVWSLNTENPSEGEKYFLAEMSYRDFRRYVHSSLYSVETDEGEQRLASRKHLDKIRNAIINGNYTPQVFNVCVPELYPVNVDEDGTVIIPLAEDNKLALLDGGTRFRSLEQIRASKEEYEFVIDGLSIPVIVYLEPEKRKQYFLNLNNGTKVNKSHLQVMEISSGRVTDRDFPIYDRAKKLSLLLNKGEVSPLHDLVTYGCSDEIGKIQFSQLVTNHKASLIASLFGGVKLLEITGQDDQEYLSLFVSLFDLVKERTTCAESGNLLALPPNGPKGNVGNWLSVVNTTLYFLYLQREMDQSDEISENSHSIVQALRVYENPVAGDISRKRRVGLSQVYAQRLFASLEENPDSPTGFHFGVPITLLANTSCSSFGVESLPSLKKKK